MAPTWAKIHTIMTKRYIVKRYPEGWAQGMDQDRIMNFLKIVMLDGTHLSAGHVALDHQLSHDAGLPPPRLLDQWDLFPLQIELFVNMNISFKTVVQIPWISVISSHNPAHYLSIPQFSMAI